MSKTRMTTYLENREAILVFQLTQKWNKKNNAQTLEHIVKSWLRQYEEKVRQQLKEKEARDEN